MIDPTPLISPWLIWVLGAFAMVAVVILVGVEWKANRERGKAFEEHKKPPTRMR